MVFRSIVPEKIKEIVSSPDKALEGLNSKVEKSIQDNERNQSASYKRALDRLIENQDDPNKNPKQNLRSISKILSVEAISQSDKDVALKVLRHIDQKEISEWANDNPEMGKYIAKVSLEKLNLGTEKFTEIKEGQTLSQVAGNKENLTKLRSLSAKELLKPGFTSPEGLRALFLENGIVNFHGNTSAMQRIGAGDFFGPEQDVISVTSGGKERIGKRSVGASYSADKIGYRDQEGYISITGGESIRANVTIPKEQDFEVPEIDTKFEYTLADGTKLTGEEAYKASFNNEVITEKTNKTENEVSSKNFENIQDQTLDVKVDLTRLRRGPKQLERVLSKILAHKEDYIAVEKETGVPWKLIAAIHFRESSNKFNRYLHNGQKLGKVTTIVPKGIFFKKGQWKEAAIHALKGRASRAGIQPNASIGEMAEFAERYNGLGYRNKGKASPYVYSGTNKYESGMYVRDGKFSSSAVDRRLGVVPIILALETV